MAKCWYCKSKKGKRYCSPIENILCPICCGKNRLVTIDCEKDCKHLDGIAYQMAREEEKEFSKLMEAVPHSQHDDIFQDLEVTLVASEIETIIRDIYVQESFQITDKIVYNSYKKVYQRNFKNEESEEDKLDMLTIKLLQYFDRNIEYWEENLERSKIGQVFLRLMISIKNMSGGRMGEFGYLNYLKNNLASKNLENHFIVEDKFGNKTSHSTLDD